MMNGGGSATWCPSSRPWRPVHRAGRALPGLRGDVMQGSLQGPLGPQQGAGQGPWAPRAHSPGETWTPRHRQRQQPSPRQAGVLVPAAEGSAGSSSSLAGGASGEAPTPAAGPSGLAPAAAATLQQCASAPELLRVLEEQLERGGDDEQLALGALQLANVRRHDPRFIGSDAELDALLLGLERVLRRNLVALTPEQLGLATRLYVVLGGSSQAMLGALQQEACSWAAADYSLRPLSELAWSLAWIKRAPAAAFASHLGHIVRDLHRDWGEFFAQAKAGRLVMLLWGLASLGCEPSEAFIEAACRQIQHAPLAGLSAKSLTTLLWALARLEASDSLAVDALSIEICSRMEMQLCEEPSVATADPAAAAASRSYQHHAERQLQQDGGAAETGSNSWEGAGPVHSQGADTGTAEGDWERWSQSETIEEYGSQGWVVSSDARLAKGSEEEPVSWDASSSSSSASGSSGGAWTVVSSSTDAAVQWDNDLTPGLLSTLVWAWGKLHYRSRPGLRMATLLLYGAAKELSAVDISRVLWGLAQLEYSQTQLLGALCARLAQPGELASFSMHQIATVTYAFSTMDYFPGEPLLDLIADCCLEARKRFDPRSLCHVLWSLARLGYLDEPFYLEFVPVVLSDIHRYSPAELADLARVYAKFGLEPPGLFEAIAEQTVASMQDADIQDLLRILTAFNQLGLQPDSLLAAVEAWANQRLRQLSPQALTLALGTFARLGSPLSPALLAAAAECVAQQLPQFEPVQLALVVWSFAKLGYHAPAILDHATLLLVEHTERFSDKAVSNVLWALATQRHTLHQGEEALERVAHKLLGRLKCFGGQSLSNIAWSYATLGHTPPPQFLKELGDAAKGLLPAFEPQGLAMLVWAMATLGYCHDALLTSIDAYCAAGGRLRGFEGQHLSNLLWGMAKVGFSPGPGFWKQCAHEASLLVADLGPQELFNIGWAYATLRLHPRRLMAALAAEAARRPFVLSPQELSGLLWALARLRHASTGGAALAWASEQEIERRAGQFEDRHLAVTVWAWAELGHRPGGRAAAAVQGELGRRAGTLAPQTLCMLSKGLSAIQLPPSPPVAAALTARAVQLLPEMKSFERAELLHSWLALGLREEAEQLLQRLAASPSSSDAIRSPRKGSGPAAVGEPAWRPTAENGVVLAVAGSDAAGAAAATAELIAAAQQKESQRANKHGTGAGPGPRAAAAAAEPALLSQPRPAPARPSRPASPFSLLEEVVASGPLPSVIYLLASMAELGTYPEPAFSQVCKRLRAASPSYRFSQRDLARLAGAVASADEEHRRRIVLKRGLQERAAAAAAASLGQPGRRAAGPGHAKPQGDAAGDVEGVGKEGAHAARLHRHDWFPPDPEEAPR